MARIIVADDNKITQMFYENILGYLGHEFKICTSGKEVIEEFIRKPADLLILDYQMPTMDVFEACRMLRSSAEGVTVPIIIVSSTQDKELIMEGLDAGASDFLHKPVTEAHLIAKLKNFLKISSLHKKDLDLVKNQTVFAGHYRIQKLLGYGSHSVVFLATDEKGGGGEVAIKLLRESADMEIFAPMFMDTAAKMKKISSDKILKIFEYGQYGGRLYLIMEYAEQKDLSSLLKTRTLSDRETAYLVSSMLDALKVLDDNGLVHFDIKPENILIKENLFKLGDFGIIPLANSKSTISMDSKNIWTTISYLAPENLNISSQQTFTPDIKCDIYSLGVTAYQAFTGDNPFAADKMMLAINRVLNHVPSPIHLHSPAVMRIFSDAIESMLLKEPATRPTIEELRQAFAGINAFLAGREPVYFGGVAAQPEEGIPMSGAAPIGSDVGSGRAAEPPQFIPMPEPTSDQFFRNLPLSQESFTHRIRGVLFQYVLAAILLGGGALLGLAAYNFMMKRLNPPDENASFYVVKCRSCGQTQEMGVSDIRNTKCQFCRKSDLCYMMNCTECGNSFPFRSELPGNLKTKEEFMAAMQDINRCPSCGSSRIEPACTSVKMMKKLKSAAEAGK